MRSAAFAPTLSLQRVVHMAKITISYRREDSMDITGRIFDRLSSHYGRETVFRDIDNIPPGIDFREHIRASIEDSGVMTVVVGPRWIGGARRGQPRIHAETDYVRIEVADRSQAAHPRHPVAGWWGRYAGAEPASREHP